MSPLKMMTSLFSIPINEWTYKLGTCVTGFNIKLQVFYGILYCAGKIGEPANPTPPTRAFRKSKNHAWDRAYNEYL